MRKRSTSSGATSRDPPSATTRIRRCPRGAPAIASSLLFHPCFFFHFPLPSLPALFVARRRLQSQNAVLGNSTPADEGEALLNPSSRTPGPVSGDFGVGSGLPVLFRRCGCIHGALFPLTIDYLVFSLNSRRHLRCLQMVATTARPQLSRLRLLIPRDAHRLNDFQYDWLRSIMYDSLRTRLRGYLLFRDSRLSSFLPVPLLDSIAARPRARTGFS